MTFAELYQRALSLPANLFMWDMYYGSSAGSGYPFEPQPLSHVRSLEACFWIWWCACECKWALNYGGWEWNGWWMWRMRNMSRNVEQCVAKQWRQEFCTPITELSCCLWHDPQWMPREDRELMEDYSYHWDFSLQPRLFKTTVDSSKLQRS